jgi:hypothetical protein
MKVRAISTKQFLSAQSILCRKQRGEHHHFQRGVLNQQERPGRVTSISIPRAALWQNGVMIDLNVVIRPVPPYI